MDSTDTNTSYTLFSSLLTTSFAVSSVGYVKLVWFISIGYGYAVAAMAFYLTYLVAALTFHAKTLDLDNVHLLLDQLVLLVVYGVRLGTHVLRRERNAHYRRAATEAYGDTNGKFGGGWRGVAVKTMIWTSVAPLYVAMISPAAFHFLYKCGNSTESLSSSTATTPWSIPAGLCVMLSGLLLEGLADRQKTAAKRVDPTRFCDAKLYAWVRCPNYLGEVLFWVGNWIVGLPSYAAPWQWAMSTCGLGCIISIMLGSTKRLERSQMKRYGHMEEFREYTRTVPILVPWVPIYSLAKVKYTLG